MNSIRVPVVEKILSANDQLASQNRLLLKNKRVFSINMMASPGAGKTSLFFRRFMDSIVALKLVLLKVIQLPVTIDADKVRKLVFLPFKSILAVIAIWMPLWVAGGMRTITSGFN